AFPRTQRKTSNIKPLLLPSLVNFDFFLPRPGPPVLRDLEAQESLYRRVQVIGHAHLHIASRVMVVANDLLTGLKHYGKRRHQRESFRSMITRRRCNHRRVQAPSVAGIFEQGIANLSGKHRRWKRKGGVAWIVSLINAVSLRIMPVKWLA